MARSLAMVGALAVIPGCSFLFVEAPPSDHARRADFTCTTNVTSPVIDTVIGGGLDLLGGSMVLDGASDPGPFGGISILAGLIVLVTGVIETVSAFVGYIDTSECSDALDGLARRQRDAPPSAPPQAPPPQPALVIVPAAPHETPVLLFPQPTPPPAQTAP